VGTIFGGTIPASTWQHFMKRALDGVPITQFADPAPIQTVANDAERAQRHGFDPGPRRYPSGPPSGGPYEVEATPPEAVAPATTSTTTSTTLVTPTTPTTKPKGGGGGGGGTGGTDTGGTGGTNAPP